MPEPPEPLGNPELIASARLSEQPTLAEEVTARLPRATEPRPVSVSDLLDPRRAFWRKLRGPAPIPLERELRLERGRAWHRRLGDAVASEGRLEVRLRRGGISARIDLLADVPVEIKTAPAASSPPADWPDQVEQLAVYCALVGRGTGRLVHLAIPEEGVPAVSVGELSFRDLDTVSAELGRREAGLRSALDAGRPEGLDRCRWYDAGCEYRQRGICDCGGDEPEAPASIVEQLEQRTDRPEIAVRWTEALRSAPPPAGPSLGRFRELLYPRRAYFDRTAGRPPLTVPVRPRLAPLDAYERTIAALERGPAGDLCRFAALAGGPEEEVVAWRGSPCVLRSSRVRGRLSADDVSSRFPQYVLDLGFRCAQTGSTSGTLVVGYENPPPSGPQVQVFRLELGGALAAFARAADERWTALGQAVADRAPGALASCPGWMVPDCPYRAVCGCAPDAGRSHR